MAKLNFIKPTGSDNIEQEQSAENRLTFIESANPKPETAPAVKNASQIEEEAERRNYAAQMQQRDRENAALRQLAEETVAQNEKPSFGEFIGGLFRPKEWVGDTIRRQAEIDQYLATDDYMSPVESAAIGASKIPVSVGTAIGKAIERARVKDDSTPVPELQKQYGKYTGDHESDADDFYKWWSQQQQTAQQENPIAYGAGDMAASMALMQGISSGLGAVKGFEKLPALARSIISGATSLGGTRAASEAGAVSTGQISGKKFASDVIGSTLGGGIGGAASSFMSGAGNNLLNVNSAGVAGAANPDLRLGGNANGIMARLGNWGLSNNRLARTIVSGLSGASFAGTDANVQYAVSRLFNEEEEQMTRGEVLKEILLGFAFGSISYLTRDIAYSRAGKAAQDGADAYKAAQDAAAGGDSAAYEEAVARLQQSAEIINAEAASGALGTEAADAAEIINTVAAGMTGGMAAEAAPALTQVPETPASAEPTPQDMALEMLEQQAAQQATEQTGNIPNNFLPETAENDKIIPTLEERILKAENMQISGSSPSEIYSETGLVTSANGSLSDGFGGPVVKEAANGKEIETGSSGNLQNALRGKNVTGGTAENGGQNLRAAFSTLGESEKSRGADIIRRAINEDPGTGILVDVIDDEVLNKGRDLDEVLREYAGVIYDDILESRIIAEQKWGSTIANSGRMFDDLLSISSGDQAPSELSNPASLEPIAETLGSSGQKAILNAYDGETQTDVYAKEFLNVYNAAQNGGKLPETKALTEAQRYAAETAGRNDAALTAQTIKEDMTYGGREETGAAGAAGDYGAGEGSMGLQSQRPAVEAGRVDKGAAAAGAGNPVGAEAQGAGGNRPEVRGGAKDREVSESLTLDGVADAASLGIENGDTTQKVRLVESGSSPAMKNAEKIARKSGHKITPFVGGYLAAGENKSIQAASMPNGDILAAADDPEFEMDRLAGHEVCEDEIRKGDVSVKDAIRTVREKVGDEKVNRVLDAYRSLHYDEKELVCDAAGNMNRLAAYEDAGGYIAELKGTMDEVLSVLHDYVNVNGAYDDVPALEGYAGQQKSAEVFSAERNTDSENEDTGVQFSSKSDVNPEILSIKNQIRENADILNSMEPVANISVENRKDFSDVKNVEWAVEKLKTSGYAVDRQNFGTIKFGKPQIDRAIRYLDTPGEIGAIVALPKVLKRGLNIGEHADHKDRGYNTITIAAPVVINGVRGNMAAVVAKTKGYNYRVHRVVMPDGSAFTFNEKENAESGLAKAPTQSEGLVVPTDTASAKTVSQSSENVNKTEFSMAAPVEEINKLIALHNMTEGNLRGALELGGLPMPSVAVVRADTGHTKYGPISVVFDKSSIDPQADYRNKVYGGDAWTPTAPAIEYEVNDTAAKRIRDKYYSLARSIGYDAARPLYNYANDLENTMNRNGGEKGIVESVSDDTDMMNLFLADTGKGLKENVQKETVRRLDDAKIEQYDYLIQALGVDVIKELYPNGESPITVRKRWIEKHGADLEDAYRGYLSEIGGISESEINDLMENPSFSAKALIREAVGARDYLKNGPETRRTEIDTEATKDAIRKATDQEEYSKWLNDLFRGIEKRKGIYNGKDPFTSSGNSRTWGQLHSSYTLENIVSAMRNAQQERGQGAWGVSAKTLQAVAAPEYRTIQEIRNDSGKLGNVENEEYESLVSSLDDRITGIIEKIQSMTKAKDTNRFIEADNIATALKDAASGKKTIDAIVKSFSENGYRISSTTAGEIQSIYRDAANLPTEYFEAKPQRAVKFDEALAVVVPSDIDKALKNSLQDAGATVLTYRTGDEADRLKKVNSVQGAQFSNAARPEDIAALARMSDNRIDSLIDDSGAGKKKDYAQKWITSISPTDFLNLTLKEKSQDRSLFDNRPGDYGSTVNDSDYIEFLKKETRQTPFLSLSPDGTVAGHEGRHRMRALEKAGVNSAEIAVMFYDDDGRLMKDVNNINGRLETLKQIKIYNQYGTGQSARLQNVIPLNIDHRDEIFASYGERNASASDVVYSSASTEADSLRMLQQENKRLQKQVDDLRAQFKTTNRSVASFRPGDLIRAARELIRSNASTMKEDELAQKLEPVYRYIAEGGADGDELTYAGMMERITTVAREIADSAEVIRSTDYDSYKALRDYLKGTKLAISQADRADVNNGEYEGFRKSHFGTMTLGTTGVPVDTAYQELQHIMGTGFFPDDITHPADQLEQIASVMDALRPVAENPFSLDMEEAVNYISNEIADSFFSVRETAPTFADRAKASKEAALARQKENLTANYEDRMTKQEADYEAKIAKQKANMQVAKEAALKRAAQQRADAISKLKTHYAEVNELRRERKQNADARKKLLNLARRLDRMKTTRANRAVIDEVLKNLDTVSVSMTGKTIDKLSDLLVWYQNKAQTDPDFIRDPGVEAKISRLAKHQIKDLNMEQVRDLTDLLRGIEQGIRTQGRMISVINGKTVYRYDDRDAHMMGLDTIRDIENTRGTKRDLMDWLVTNELSPERFMHRITGYNDSDPLYMATKALSEGQRIMMDYQMRAQKRFQKWMDDKKFIKHIRGEKADTIEITGVQDGNPVTAKITPDMRMALCLHSLNDQNLRHAQTGGVTIPDLELLNKGKIAEAYERGVTIKLSPSNIRSIISKMSAQEWAYASAARDYFNGMSSDEINAVSEALVGYSIAGVNEYFPINTDTRFSRKEFDTLKKDGTIEGMGFLKERINASNPIMLRGLTDVLNQSIGMHAKYVGLAVPVRNFNLLWNTTASGAPDDEGNRERFTKSVQTVVGGKWGARATDYVEKLMTDLQTSGHPADELDKFFGKVRSNYAGAVLTLNPSVAIKQAASYPTAAAVLGWGPIIKAMKYNGHVDLDLIAKYTPLQWYRGLGYSTQELGDIASRKDSAMNKIMGLSFTVKGYEVAPLNWIQMIDLLTTRKLWKASEIYVRDNQKDLTPGGDDYYRAVAEIYNRVIEETQPNYTTMQRPQILRSDNSLAKSVVNFKTQPFQNFNILYDAFANMQAKHRAWKNTGSEESKKAYDRARKEAGDAFTSQFAAALTFSGMTAAASLLLRRFKHRYGDKNEDVTTGSFFTKFAKDFVGNYAGMAIFGTEAYDAANSLVFGDTYYGPDAISVSAISDAATTVLNTWNYIQSVMDDVKEGKKINLNRMRIKLTALAESVSKVFGYPVENVTGMGEAAFRTAAEQIAGKYLGTYSYLRLTKDMESSANDFYRNLYNAMQNDTGAYEELYAQMVEDGFDEKKIKSYIEGRMKEEQGVEHVSDLDERYMSPAQKRSYNQAERELNRGNVYGMLKGEKREDVEEYIRDYATKDSDWKKVLEKFDGYQSVGLDELDILEFLTCRSYQDDPNKNGNLHTYTNKEIEFAIRTMAGKGGNNLTKEQKDFFWIACGKKADKTPKW